MDFSFFENSLYHVYAKLCGQKVLCNLHFSFKYSWNILVLMSHKMAAVNIMLEYIHTLCLIENKIETCTTTEVERISQL